MKPWPSSGPTLPICESAHPPSPAMPEPMAKASRSTRGVRTPRPAARCRSWVTARTRSPSRVRVSRAQTPSSTPAEKRRMTMRFQGRTRSGSRVTPPDIQLGFETSTFCAPKATRTVWMMQQARAPGGEQRLQRTAVELPHHRRSPAARPPARRRGTRRAARRAGTSRSAANPRNAVWTSQVAYAPTISSSPWAMLMTPIKPKVIASPSAASSRMLPRLSPEKSQPHHRRALERQVHALGSRP